MVGVEAIETLLLRRKENPMREGRIGKNVNDPMRGPQRITGNGQIARGKGRQWRENERWREGKRDSKIVANQGAMMMITRPWGQGETSNQPWR